MPMPQPCLDGRECLREWSEIHIGETLELEPRIYKDALFRECTIKKCAGTVLINCCLTDSKFDIEKIEDMLGLHVGLDCQNFSNVEYNDLAFNYFMLLAVRMKGHTKARLAIIEHVLGGKDAVRELLNADYPGNE